MSHLKLIVVVFSYFLHFVVFFLLKRKSDTNFFFFFTKSNTKLAFASHNLLESAYVSKYSQQICINFKVTLILNVRWHGHF